MTIIEQLKRDEGRSSKPYRDTRGIWTVGYGHNLTVGALSEDAMTQILRDDIAAALTECLRLPFWFALSVPRQGALLNLTFNQGIGWVGKNPVMVDALTRGDYPAAAAALLDGPYKNQVGARAHRMAKQLTDDTWV